MAYFIDFEKYSGIKNMELDESLIDLSIKNLLEPTLRLYGWSSPTLSLGRNQSLKGINQEYCDKNNIDIVKRPTGGRAVLHENELTYCFITPISFLNNGNSVIDSYKEISEALILAFTKLDINLSFPEYKKISVKDGYCMAISTGSDLNYKNKKFIGSAQFRKQNYILQHGSILIEVDEEKISNIFSNKENSSNVITLNQIKEYDLEINTLCKNIKNGFKEKFSFDFKTFPF